VLVVATVAAVIIGATACVASVGCGLAVLGVAGGGSVMVGSMTAGVAATAIVGGGIAGSLDIMAQKANDGKSGSNCPDDETVTSVLRGKLGSIKRKALDPGSPSWSDIGDMSIDQVRAAAKANQPGFRTILKLLQDRRFNKPS